MQQDACQLKNTLRNTLLQLGAIREETVEIYSTHTRDKTSLTVYRDTESKVIFIDDYYVGDEVYVNGKYQCTKKTSLSYEDWKDNHRRVHAYNQFIVAKSVVDFGCGRGHFLKCAQSYAASVTGIELQQDRREALNHEGIKCYKDVSSLTEAQDVFTLFHCFEHLPDPISVLKNIYRTLKPKGQGKIIIEVPHARDFLIDKLGSKPFIDFTLWSQHLILHTRESLSLMLSFAGFKNIYIEGVQRYGIANHLHWLRHQQPGGHKEMLSIIETDTLATAYAEALSKIDANDTLVAIAET